MSIWQISRGPCGDWHWGFRLPNDVCGGVSDISQMIAPRQPTKYRASLALPTEYIDLGEYDTLEEAKSVALNAALERK